MIQPPVPLVIPGALLGIGLGVAATAASAVAQTWIQKTSPHGYFRTTLAWDPARQRPVQYGGAGASPSAEMLTFDGAQWVDLPAAASAPGPMTDHAMAADPLRGVVVLFGDGEGSRGNETWEWDGATWRQVVTALTPPDGRSSVLAYDEARGIMVLVGTASTWEYNGATWSDRSPARIPSAAPVAATYDPLRGRTLLIADDASTWEWNGTQWQRREPPGAPTAAQLSFGGGLAFDRARGRAVLLTSTHFSAASSTWEWDGNTWTAAGAPSPPAMWSTGWAVYDETLGRVLIRDTDEATQVWNGTIWSEIAAGSDRPGRVMLGAVAFDAARQEVVHFGGLTAQAISSDETHLFDGVRWRRHGSGARPIPRGSAAMAWDSARQRVLLFGGTNYSIEMNDTWEWDGQAWNQLAPANSPSRRSDAALAEDPVRGRLVLFSGFGGTDDTWEWDGTDWLQQSPANRPPAGDRHAMAFDPARNTVLLHDGRNVATWEWDGTDWTQLQQGNGPTGTALDLVTQAGTGKVLALDRTSTWEWDGGTTTWRVVTSTGPTSRLRPKLAYDEVRQRAVLFGGGGGGYAFFPRDTWIYGTTSAASSATYGSGCTGAAGVPLLAPLGSPMLGNDRFGLDVARARPAAAAGVLLAASEASFPLGSCTLLVAPPFVTLAGLTNGSGLLALRVPIPDDAALLGGRLAAQGLVVDAAGAFPPLAMTAGLRLTLGE
ncbi:MAG: hypothetical protein AAF628_30895 [Planctomycetota bacterium]